MELIRLVKTRCEVYSRIVGYIRPLEQWHEGKQTEFRDRVNYDKNKINPNDSQTRVTE